MPVIYRPWISPYGDDDFEWDREKSLATFADRDFVFEAARIIFRGPLVRRPDTRRRRPREPRFMVLGELYGRVIVVIYTPRNRKCRIISMRPANAVEREIYYGHTAG
ncbi:MAG TPA: BrnT family toxin [Stellaceae bacterium]|nr:BrnT family toxin [Stellaceae bacterium]